VRQVSSWRARRLRQLPAGLGAAAALLVSAQSNAKPQWNTGLETGVCGSGSSLGFEHLGWCNALHADLLLLRQRGSDFGVGPSLRLGTARFDDVRLDAGVSLLIPSFDSFPVVLEVGPHLRNFRQPGIFGSAFFGFRSLNHHGNYEIASGLSIIAERSFSVDTPSALWITARIDGAWLALPFIFVYNAAR
jgi:hypothetical protein